MPPKTSLAWRTTNQLAAEGEQALIHTLAQMEGIRTSVDQSAQSVRALGEKASSIGAMGQIIIEIAEQTSLLALNAQLRPLGRASMAEVLRL